MKRIGSFLLALSLCLSLSVPAHGAEAGQTVPAGLARSLRLFLEEKDAGLLADEKDRREAIVYGGTAYIPLYTVGLWMGADAVCDKDAGTVCITSGVREPIHYSSLDFNHMDVERQEGVEQFQDDMVNGIEVELCPRLTVTVDGQALTFTAGYPLLFRDCVYLPAQDVGALCGKQVLEFDFPGSTYTALHFYDAPTGRELAQAWAYFIAARQELDRFNALVASWEEESATGESFAAAVRALCEPLQAIQALEPPDFPGAGWYVYGLRDNTDLVLEETLRHYLTGELQPSFFEQSPQRQWEHLLSVLYPARADSFTYYSQLEDWCDRSLAFLSAVTDHASLFSDADQITRAEMAKIAAAFIMGSSVGPALCPLSSALVFRLPLWGNRKIGGSQGYPGWCRDAAGRWGQRPLRNRIAP